MNEVLSASSNYAEWQAARQRTITATDVADILGLGWESPRAVYERKKGIRADKEQTEAMWLGTELEPFIASMFAKKNGYQYGVEIIPCGFVTAPDNTRHGATPDYEFIPGLDVTCDKTGRKWKSEEVGIECKFAGAHTARNFGSEGTDEVPTNYIIQTQWQMRCRPQWKVVILVLFTAFGGLKHFFIERDDELIRRMTFKVNVFCGEYLDSNMPPPISGSESDTKALNEKWDEEQGKLIAASYELEETIAELREIKESVKCGEMVEDEFSNRIREFMGDATELDSTEGKFSWRRNSDSVKTDWEACYKGLMAYATIMLSAQPDTAQLFTNESIRLVNDLTVTKPGARVLRTPWRAEKS